MPVVKRSRDFLQMTEAKKWEKYRAARMEGMVAYLYQPGVGVVRLSTRTNISPGTS